MYVLSKPLELVSLDAHTTNPPRRPNKNANSKIHCPFSTLENSVTGADLHNNLFYIMRSARGFIQIRAENLVCDRDAAAAAEKAG